MRIFKIILFILLIPLAVSCGNKEKQTNYPDQINYKQNDYEIEKQSDFERLVSRTFLTSKTPFGLGLLLSKNDVKSKSTIGSCTWFIVNKNHAMTNSHCIPKKLKNNTSLDCSKYLGGVIKTQKGDKRFYCKKVVHVSKIKKETFNDPDYALIELNENFNGQSNFHFSRDGFLEGAKTVVHAINTIKSGSDLLYGSYRKKDCVSYQRSFFGAFISKVSSIIPIFDEDSYTQNCKIIQGNSGSPVTDSNDQSKTIGVVFASSKEGKKLQGSNQFDFSKVEGFALITNFSCLNISTLNKDRDPKCEQIIEDEKKRALEIKLDAVTQATNKVENQLNDIFETLSPIYRYKLQQLDSLNINIEAKCVLPLKIWPEVEIKKIEYTGLIFISRRPTYTSIVPNIGIEMKFELSQYGVIDNKVEVYRKLEKEYYLDDLNLFSDVPSELGTIIITDPTLKSSDEKYPLKLRVCSEDDIDADELKI